MNALTPYLLWIKLGGLALALLMAFFGGCHVQKGRDAETMAAKDQALGAAAASLRGSAKALRDVNAEAARRIKAAEEAARIGLAAGEAAMTERRRQEETVTGKAKEFDRQLLIAQRRKVCKAWLDTNVAEICGL